MTFETPLPPLPLLWNCSVRQTPACLCPWPLRYIRWQMASVVWKRSAQCQPTGSFLSPGLPAQSGRKNTIQSESCRATAKIFLSKLTLRLYCTSMIHQLMVYDTLAVIICVMRCSFFPARSEICGGFVHFGLCYCKVTRSVWVKFKAAGVHRPCCAFSPCAQSCKARISAAGRRFNCKTLPWNETLDDFVGKYRFSSCSSAVWTGCRYCTGTGELLALTSRRKKRNKTKQRNPTGNPF